MPNLLTEGTYEDGLEIIGTRLESHKEGEPKVVVTLAEPGAGDDAAVTDFPKVSDYLYTSNDAWDKVTAKRLAAYGWDAEANSFDLGFFNNPENKLIGTIVKPVVLKAEEYTDKNGNKKTSIKVYRVGNEKFGYQMGDEQTKIETSLFQQRMRMRMANAGAAKFADALPSYGAPAVATAKAPTDDIPF